MNLFKIINIRVFNHQFRLNKITVNYFSKKIAQQTCFRNNNINNFNNIFTIKRQLNVSKCLFDVKIIQTPPFAESVSEGDVRWSKKIGDNVSVDEVIGEIETDKTAIPVYSPCNGKILELLVADGDKVVANQNLVKISIGNEVKVEGEKQERKEEKKDKKEERKENEKKPTQALQNEKLIKEIYPSVNIGGTMATTGTVAQSEQIISGTRSEQRVKMNRMRLRIAERLKSAQNTCAMLTTFNECDMSAIINLRKKYQEQFQKKHEGVKLGFMSAFLKGAALALADQPVVNAVIDGQDIVYRDYIDISVAVATPKGLVVPVLRNVQEMAGFAEIEKAISELGERARLGQLAIEDMDGGTFTVSNGGVFGSLMGTPIINPPQSAILGIHATQQRPVAIDGRVEIRPMMYLALTYDHRLIDGREAVLFLKRIKAFIEDPSIMLLGL